MDKKSVLAFVLIFLVIIGMPYYYKMVNPEMAQQQTGQHTVVTKDSTLTHTVQSTPITPVDQPPIKTPVKNISPADFLTNIDEQVYTIETENYIAELSNISGGTLTSFTLKKHKLYKQGDTSLVQMIYEPEQYPLAISYISIENQSSINLNIPFEMEKDSRPSQNSHYIIPKDEQLTLTFVLKDKNAVLTRKTLTFNGNDYTIDLLTDMSGLKEDMATRTYQISWNAGLNYTEPMIEDETRYSMAYAHSGGETEKLDIKNGKEEVTNFKGNTEWTAIRTKYFSAAFIPQTQTSGYALSGEGLGIAAKQYFKYYAMNIEFPVEQVSEMTVFVGPLNYDDIKILHPELEDIMTLGNLLRPICKGVLWLFKKMYSVIPNYGFVLIIFSILIKVVLTPLTNKSMQSMKEMQKIQPQINELREKYGNDQQKMSQAQMALFKEHGVNPMGGCLPMLLQMPILISLFTVFRSTIELRHAPFLFWITDLSAPDTIYTLPFTIPLYGKYVNVLPFVMAITQFIQTKVSGQSANPQQKSMTYMMPIMFFFLFNKFPSGLNLYYTLFNVLSMVQQKYLVPEKTIKPENEKKPGKIKSRMEMLQQMQKSRNKK